MDGVHASIDLPDRFIQRFRESPTRLSLANSLSCRRESGRDIWEAFERLPWRILIRQIDSGDFEARELVDNLVEFGALPSALEGIATKLLKGVSKAKSSVSPHAVAETLSSWSSFVEKTGPDSALSSEVINRTMVAFLECEQRQNFPTTRARDALVWLGAFETEFSPPYCWLICERSLEGRAKAFEVSLANQLNIHRFAPALRVALYGSMYSGERATESDKVIARADDLVENSALGDLARVLIEMRGRIPKYLHGYLPISKLQPWINYLSGEVQNLVESFQIQPREAVSFAHYSLHLMNICDLGASSDFELSNEARKRLLGFENRLKNFATIQGNSAEVPKLEESEFSDEYGSDRYARHRIRRLIGDIGDDDSFEHHWELSERKKDRLTEMLKRTSVSHVDWLAYLPEETVVDLLSLILVDSSVIDEASSLYLNFESIAQWVENIPDAEQKLQRLIALQVEAEKEITRSGPGLFVEQAEEYDHDVSFRIDIEWCTELRHLIGILAREQYYSAEILDTLKTRAIGILEPVRVPKAVPN